MILEFYQQNVISDIRWMKDEESPDVCQPARLVLHQHLDECVFFRHFALSWASKSPEISRIDSGPRAVSALKGGIKSKVMWCSTLLPTSAAYEDTVEPCEICKVSESCIFIFFSYLSFILFYFRILYAVSSLQTLIFLKPSVGFFNTLIR